MARSSVRRRLLPWVGAVRRRGWPAPLRRAGALVDRLAGRSRPLVTVVVSEPRDPESGESTGSALAASLASIEAQPYRPIEVLVVGCVAGEARSGGPEPGAGVRIRRLGPYQSVDRGHREAVSLARGRYLQFLPAGFRLPTRSLTRAIASLERTGSQLASGRLARPAGFSPSVLPPYDPVHEVDRTSVSLPELPLVAWDAELCTRLCRTDLLRRAIAAGPPTALGLWAEAEHADLLADPMALAPATPDGRLPDPTAGLSSWLAENGASEQLAVRLGEQAASAWRAGQLDGPVAAMLAEPERLDARDWGRLRDRVTGLVAGIDAEAMSRVRVESRIRARLLIEDRRTELEEFAAARWYERDNLATQVRDGQVYADLDLVVPERILRMDPPLTPARVLVRAVRSPAPGVFEITVLTRIELVDMAVASPSVGARLHRVDAGGSSIDLRVTTHPDPSANLVIDHAYQDYRPGGATFRVEAEDLTPGSWVLEVEVEVNGVRRATTRAELDPRGTARLFGTPYLADHRLSGTRLGIRYDGRVLLEAAPAEEPAVSVDSVLVGDGHATLTLAAGHGLTSVRAGDQEAPVVGDTARLRLPDRDAEALTGLSAGGPGRPRRGIDLAWPVGAWTECRIPATGPNPGGVTVTRTADGTIATLPALGHAELCGLTLEGQHLVVHGRWLGGVPDRPVALAVTNGRAHVSAEVISRSDGTLTASLPLRWSEWGGPPDGWGEAPVPQGEYRFELDLGDGAAGVLHCAASYLGDLLRFQLGETFRLRPVRTGDGRPAFFLGRPLRLEDSGAYPQRLLQERLLASTGPVDEGVVYLMTYAGSSATDSQLAMHRHLRRTRPDLSLVWGVAGADSRVPEGGSAVMLNSPEWYDVLATAGWIVQNIDFDRWWRKRPGQRYLQTFHGYPSKSMGLRQWRAKGFTPRRLRAELDKAASQWDLILTPAPEMDEHYRREYDYAGAICAEGYPRDDALVLPGADVVRERTRRLLGVAPHQKAVLYAPTWREHLATNWRRAAMVAHLDPQVVSESLGDDYVLLQRGHRFNSAQVARRGVVDVTDYPEINDLILASDAAVLDYSSLRFDYALTGRPMVFLVPDLDEYVGGLRGFLFDYATSAPGPLVSTGAEVVAALADLDGLNRTYAAELAAFNARFNRLNDGGATERVVGRFFG
ncbi:MAG: CDP-glycerol glycerophosphotransferase family protein [Nocardioides sp.]|uniref:CDP-glycerol glycerophosphotransferase family protein n=1 Tax=Nocardioides sp. TaxID=35761 RepID=UPI0039E37858